MYLIKKIYLITIFSRQIAYNEAIFNSIYFLISSFTKVIELKKFFLFQLKFIMPY